jgi:hypothetical protein
VCLQMAAFLRNSADFLFKAFGIRVAELSVNAAELSVNSAELSVNATRFRFLKVSRSFHMSNAFRLNFSEFHRIFRKPAGSATTDFFALHEFSNSATTSLQFIS